MGTAIVCWHSCTKRKLSRTGTHRGQLKENVTGWWGSWIRILNPVEHQSTNLIVLLKQQAMHFPWRGSFGHHVSRKKKLVWSSFTSTFKTPSKPKPAVYEEMNYLKNFIFWTRKQKTNFLKLATNWSYQCAQVSLDLFTSCGKQRFFYLALSWRENPQFSQVKKVNAKPKLLFVSRQTSEIVRYACQRGG